MRAMKMLFCFVAACRCDPDPNLANCKVLVVPRPKPPSHIAYLLHGSDPPRAAKAV